MDKAHFSFVNKRAEKEFFKFLDKLPDRDAAKLLATIHKIEKLGIKIAIKMLWVKKLTYNLYEIRSQVGRNQRRVIYFHVEDNKYKITQGFTKKSPKTPKNEIRKGIVIRNNYFQKSDYHAK